MSGVMDERARQEAVETYWQEIKDDWADNQTQSEHTQGQGEGGDEKTDTGSDRPQVNTGGENGRAFHPGGLGIPVVSEDVKERAAQDYLSSGASLKTVAKRHGIAGSTLGKYLKDQRVRGDQPVTDELGALRRVLEALNGVPPDGCRRIVQYAWDYATRKEQ